MKGQFKPFAWSLFLAVLLSISACGGSSLVVSGEALKASGTQFVQVAAAYKNGCDVAKTIAPKDCAAFRTFGEQFQKSFPLSVQLWEVARATNDGATEKSATEIITDLVSRLTAFAITVMPAKK